MLRNRWFSFSDEVVGGRQEVVPRLSSGVGGSDESSDKRWLS